MYCKVLKFLSNLEPSAFRIFARFYCMWTRIARFILRNRPLLLAILGLTTLFMAYKASQVRMSYDGNRLIPHNDPDLQIYEEFRGRFGIDGNVMVAGFQSDSLFTPDLFQGLQLVTRRVKEVKGVKSVLSLANLPALVRDDTKQKFRLLPLVPDGPLNRTDLDSLKQVVHQTRMYEGIFIIPETNTTLLAIAFDGKVLDNKGRIGTVDGVVRRLDAFALNHGLTLHYSGLPYVRTVFATRVADELKLFSALALIMSGLVLFFFYRSFAPVFFSLLVVLLGAVWALGLISSFGFKITILSGLIPALVVVIGVPNCVYLLNKYHDEFRKHGNKIKALSRVVERVGLAALLTNTTTAIGFGVFYLTEVTVLKEFGLVVALSISVIFLISLIIIPIVFSYLPAPETKHLRHLERTALQSVVDRVVRCVMGYRNALYIGFVLVSLLAAVGAVQLKTRSRLVDDLPQRDRVMSDLRFFEENFAGVMPLEILIDTGRRGGIQSPKNLQKAEEIQLLLSEYREFAPPLSLVQLVKAANQAYFQGNPEYFRLPGGQEQLFVMPYLLRSRSTTDSTLASLTDTARQVFRLSLNMADVGTKRLEELLKELDSRVDSLVEGSSAKVIFTGSSLIFLRGNQYLVSSLINSLSLAIFLISIIMVVLFREVRILVISIVPNLFPLLVTAGAMGYMGVPLKPSTVLVYSMVFGISIDTSIHFLAKYRQEMKRRKWDIPRLVELSLRETIPSMIYTSLILFFGFLVFGVSTFQGTVALGMMTSCTLLVALLSNMLLLPALILSFDRRWQIIMARKNGNPIPSATATDSDE